MKILNWFDLNSNWQKELIKLYSKSIDKKIKQNYKGIKEFEDHFKFIDAAKEDNILSIDAISILKSRTENYDFSVPYMVNKYALIARKKYILKNNDKKVKVAYQTGTVYEETIETIGKLFPIVPIPQKSPKRSVKSLKDRNVDLIYTDFVDSWSFNLKVVQIINPDQKDEYGMMFKKGSKLKDEINIIYNSYIKSAAYLKLIKSHFGSHSKLFFNID